jgi:hypothetical protein
VQLDVPLHDHEGAHAVAAGQVTGAPTHAPVPSQWSPYVQALPSLHATPFASLVTTQAPVPSSAHVTEA